MKSKYLPKLLLSLPLIFSAVACTEQGDQETKPENPVVEQSPDSLMEGLVNIIESTARPTESISPEDEKLNIELSNLPLFEIGAGYLDPDGTHTISDVREAEADDFRIPQREDNRAINLSMAVRNGTGYLEQYSDDLTQFNQFFDLLGDEEYMQAVNQIAENSLEKLLKIAVIQNLLEEGREWKKWDRVTWEKGLSDTISSEQDLVPGLDSYRLSSDKDAYPDTEERLTRVNNISTDMRNGTVKYEHDCETMTITELLVATLVEMKMVKLGLMQEKNMASEGDFRKPTDYFYVRGKVNWNYRGDVVGYHAFGVSSLSLNMIEGTVSSEHSMSSYKYNIDLDYSMIDLKNGKPLIDYKQKNIYYFNTTDLGDIAQMRVDWGQINIDDIYDKIDVSWLDLGDENLIEEIKPLLQIKSDIQAIERSRPRAPIYSVMAGLRFSFEYKVQDLIENGSLMKVNNFIIDNKESTKIAARSKFTTENDPALEQPIPYRTKPLGGIDQ